MAAHQPLELWILVRIQAPQLLDRPGLIARFFLLYKCLTVTIPVDNPDTINTYSPVAAQRERFGREKGKNNF
jgi:hypothetical protein